MSTRRGGLRTALGFGILAISVLVWAAIVAVREAPSWEFSWGHDLSGILALPPDSPEINAMKLQDLVSKELSVGDRTKKVDIVDGRLIVRATFEEHRKVERFLVQLRRTAGILVTCEWSSDFCDNFGHRNSHPRAVAHGPRSFAFLRSAIGTLIPERLPTVPDPLPS